MGCYCLLDSRMRFLVAFQMNIEYLLDDLRHQVIESENFLNSTHDRLLSNLPNQEKAQVRELFCKWEWNIGSVKVLRRLQQAKLLTATDYIYRVNVRSSDEALLILNDIFETEITLLANLFSNIDAVNSRALQLVERLKDCIKRICDDLCANPNIISIDYINDVRQLITKDNFESVKLFHLDIFLSESTKNSIEEAYKLQKQWFVETKEIHNSTLMKLIGSLPKTTKCRNEIFQRIIDKASDKEFRCWKWYLYVLSECVSESDDLEFYIADELKSSAKTVMKQLFKECVENKDVEKFKFFLFTVRIICKFNEKILGNYTSWYKLCIGDMKYTLKNEEFDFVLSMLSDLVSIEQDAEFLEIHAKTHIAVPPLRNDSILNYKQLCSSRLLSLQIKNDENMDVTSDDSDVILVE